MRKSWLYIVVVYMFFISTASVSYAAISGVRSFSDDCYNAGGTVVVTITADPGAGATSYVVEDTYPSGWTVTSVDYPGRDSDSGTRVSWVLQDNTPRTLSYTLSVPSAQTGTVTFDGKIAVGANNQDLTGTNSISKCSAPQPTPVLSVSPNSRDVSASSGSTSFSVSNTGSGTMFWSASVTSGGSWLSISSGSDGTNAGTINVSYPANTSSARTGEITITASGASGSPKTVRVNQAGKDDDPSPVLSVSPEVHNVGSDLGVIEFSVSNTGGGTMTWSASVTSDSNWLKINSGASGTNSGTISVGHLTYFPSTMYREGVEYWVGEIQITAPDATGSPKTVKVIKNTPEPLYNTNISTGSLRVNIEPVKVRSEGARWSVETLDDNTGRTREILGPRESGYTLTNLPVDKVYYVKFISVWGYDDPGSITVTIQANETTVINAYYEKVPTFCGRRCSKSMITNPNDAFKESLADWLLVGLSILVLLSFANVRKHK